ncbi:SDR family NAD(P)-dependent oxidoreductase, partial [Proteus mirabilis]
MIIFITGASAGFGEAIARHFINHGHKVIGTARRLDKLQALHQELGDLFYPLQLDVTDKKAVSEIYHQLPEQWRSIDVLVNNAGLALGLSTADKA